MFRVIVRVVLITDAKIQHYQYFFVNRVIHIWNGLPDEVVAADTTNNFKIRLDKFWNSQSIKYNWKDEITGTGSRSLVRII